MGLVDEFQTWLHAPSLKASDVAEQTFPGQQWDFSQKNALRHSLATGLWAQRLGGNWLSGKAAQAMGQAWEAVDPRQYGKDIAHRLDTLHDLNNNAVGADAGVRAVNEESLINALVSMAKQARNEAPPKLGQDSPGYLTYTQNQR